MLSQPVWPGYTNFTPFVYFKNFDIFIFCTKYENLDFFNLFGNFHIGDMEEKVARSCKAMADHVGI